MNNSVNNPRTICKPTWKAWKCLRDWCNRRLSTAWMKGGGCDSCCPNCKQWESLGNRIDTESLPDGSEHRTCSNCGHEWRAIFTPAGFVAITDSQLTGIDHEP